MRCEALKARRLYGIIWKIYRIPPESRAQCETRKPLVRVAFVVKATMGACSQIVALITKNAVQSTAFLLPIAEDSKGKTQ